MSDKLIKRREFLKYTLATGGLALTGTGILNPFGRHAWAAAPSGVHMLIVYLRGGADIGFGMIQPDQSTSSGLALARIRPNVYEMNPLQLDQNSDNGWNCHPTFGALSDIYTAGQLAIIQRVGIEGLRGSHRLAELSMAYGADDARNTPQTGWLQRLGKEHFNRPSDLLDLSGGHPTTTAGGSFVPLSLNQLVQVTQVNSGVDPRWTQEGGFWRDMLFKQMERPFLGGNAEEDAVQERLNAIGESYQGLAEADDSGLPSGYFDDEVGMIFRGFEAAVNYSELPDARFNTKVAFAVVEGGFDTHRDQNVTSNNRFRTRMDDLHDALNVFRQRAAWDNSVIVLCSEMGRSNGENASAGTDHGNAFSVLAMGGRVNGGFYGGTITPPMIESSTNALPRALSWTDVCWALVDGLGYNPAPVFPGYSPKPVGNFIS